MDIFNTIIGLGGLFIFLGLYFSFIWSNQGKPENKKEKIVYKTKNDTSIPTILGNSYTQLKKVETKKDNVKGEKSFIDISRFVSDFKIDNIEEDENDNLGMDLEDAIDPQNELDLFTEDNDEKKIIDNNNNKYGDFKNIDVSKLTEEIFDDEIENQNNMDFDIEIDFDNMDDI